MSGPLHGFRIVELAAIGPVPFAGALLADLGADVVRVDRVPVLGREPDPPPRFDFYNRNKRSVAFDLKQPAGVQSVLNMVRKADVLLEGMRPGVTDRLGVGPDACLAANPRLVYGRMTGWGQQGPLAQVAGQPIVQDRDRRQQWDVIVLRHLGSPGAIDRRSGRILSRHEGTRMLQPGDS